MHAQFTYGAKYRLLDGANIAVDFICDFLETPLLKMLQDETDALDFTEMCHRRRQAFAKLFVRADVFRCRGRALDVSLERLEYAGPALAQQLQRGIDRNSMYPGIEPCGPVKLVPFVPGIEQGVLNGVFGQIAVPRDFQACRPPVSKSQDSSSGASRASACVNPASGSLPDSHHYLPMTTGYFQDLYQGKSKLALPLRDVLMLGSAVRSGLISLEEACLRYTLSVEEYLSWERAIERHDLPGLRVTRLQDYRVEPGSTDYQSD